MEHPGWASPQNRPLLYTGETLLQCYRSRYNTEGDRHRTGRCRKEQALQSFTCFPTASYKIAERRYKCYHFVPTNWPLLPVAWSGLQCSPWLRSRTLYMAQALSRFYSTGPQLCNKMEIIRLSQPACISPPFWAFCLKQLRRLPTCSQNPRTSATSPFPHLSKQFVVGFTTPHLCLQSPWGSFLNRLKLALVLAVLWLSSPLSPWMLCRVYRIHQRTIRSLFSDDLEKVRCLFAYKCLWKYFIHTHLIKNISIHLSVCIIYIFFLKELHLFYSDRN